MPLTVTTPAQRGRDAITARLSAAGNGFNPMLVACIPGGDSSPAAFEIDFADDSQNYLHGKYDIQALFASEAISLPAIAVYQGPSRPSGPRDSLIGSTFSGHIAFGLDVHLMSTEGQSQTSFDRLVSIVHDAVMNTFNAQGVADYAKRQLVWNQDIAMEQPTRLFDEEAGQYLSTLPFRLSFYAPA